MKRSLSRLFHSPFRIKIMASMVLIAFFMALYIGLISYNLSSNIIQEMGTRLLESKMAIVYQILDNYFHTVQNHLFQIVSFAPLRDIARKPVFSDLEQESVTCQIDASVRNLFTLAAGDNISFGLLNIYCKNGYNYSFDSSYTFPYNDYESCLEYHMEKGLVSEDYSPSIWTEYIALKDRIGQDTPGLINVRILYDSVNMQKIGIIISAIREKNLYEVYSNFSDGALVLRDGTLLSNSDKSQLGKPLANINLRNYIMQTLPTIGISSHLENLNNKMVAIKDVGDHNLYFVESFENYGSIRKEEMKRFIRSCLVIGLTAMLISIIISLFFSKSLSNSLLSLKEVVQHVYEGKLDARFTPNSKDEIAFLGVKINDMLDSIRDFRQTQEEHAQANRLLELRLLQSQINPHLLYNTLNSVIWFLKSDNTNNASSLIVSLSEFFKISLSSGSTLIPLKNELYLIHNYINIQRLARNKNITIKEDIDENLLELPIIKLTLQPIVENAIIHGFSGYRNDGTIFISVWQEESIVWITIEDNGIGVMDDINSKINEELNIYPPKQDMLHFGLYNINRRITETFGNGYGIYTDSEVGGFFRVTMKLPYRKDGYLCMM